MKRRRIVKNLSVLFLAYLFTGCGGLFEKPLEVNSSDVPEQGQIIVTADLSSSGDFSRMAIPEAITDLANFDYYGSLKVLSTDTPALKEGTLSATKTLTFKFDNVYASSGLTVEIYAFSKDETNHEVSNALLYAVVENCNVNSLGKISVGKITLNDARTKNGAIDLTVTLPSPGYELSVYCAAYGLWFQNDGTVPVENGSAPYIKIIKLDEIGADTYDVVLTVKKDGKVVYEWLDSVVVYSGMTTNKWLSYDGSVVEEKAITEPMINFAFQTKFYVCGGTGCAYYGVTRSDYKTPNDSNSGTLLQPLASLQEAVNKVIAANQSAPDDTSFEIYVDGRIEGNGCVANFDALSKNLKLSINSVGAGTNRATLDANLSTATNGGSVINATSEKLDLTLKNLIITGGNTTGNGGGICIDSNAKVTVDSCKITGNSAAEKGSGIYNNGTLTLTGTPEITEDNDIYVFNGNPIRTNELNCADGASIVAVITPKDYIDSTSAEYRVIGSSITNATPNEAYIPLFRVTPSATSNWKLTKFGYLEKVPFSPAEVSDFLQNYTGTYPVKLAVQIDKNNAESDFTTLKTALDAASESVELELSDGITEITNNAFQNCTSLTSVTIPASVTSIGAYAFDRCSSLASVIFGDPTGWTYESGRDTLAANFSNNYQRNATLLLTLGSRGFSKQTS